MLPIGGIIPGDGPILEKWRHCDAPVLVRRRNAVRWDFMVLRADESAVRRDAWRKLSDGREVEKRGGAAFRASSRELGIGSLDQQQQPDSAKDRLSPLALMLAFLKVVYIVAFQLKSINVCFALLPCRMGRLSASVLRLGCPKVVKHSLDKQNFKISSLSVA